jgi:hypothetical protein
MLQELESLAGWFSYLRDKIDRKLSGGKREKSGPDKCEEVTELSKALIMRLIYPEEKLPQREKELHF